MTKHETIIQWLKIAGLIYFIWRIETVIGLLKGERKTFLLMKWLVMSLLKNPLNIKKK